MSALLTEPTWAPDIVKESAETAPLDGEAPGLRVAVLPEEFWQRPVLQHIRQAAHSRNRSGDLVLGGVLARLAALVPPRLRADTGVGSPASLNLYVILFGASGSGKSSAAWIPQKLLPPPPNLDFLDGIPLGSGEGLAEAYMGEKTVETGEIHKRGPFKGDPKTEKVRAQVRHHALFYADEGESLTKQLFGRSGATVGASIRQAWTGGTFGQFNGQKVNTRVIAEGTYSMGIAVGFQPETALPLLQDAAAGTPQRFLWVSSTDPNIPDESVAWPGELDLRLLKTGRDGFGATEQLTFAREIREEIRRDDKARSRGEARLPLLDSHKPLMRVKLAALLAILDNRLDVLAEDWELALVMWETSCRIRDALIEYGERQQAAEEEKRTRALIDREVRAHAAKAAADSDIRRVARRVARKVHEAGADGMSRGALRKAVAYRDRDRLGAAVDFAESEGWVVVEGDRVVPGGSVPV
ncbi:hypothetical protein [Sphaerobacter sp.]|uniref:hypothetical protein n=1 Tax=Sphaerobacter sp. TaxID=2099654 RepID=UPI001D1EE976|nr:hypothetical protein [Sphaerobacter sp.]MBX5446626.1 hypothetical protein [Sphaerobacter sp.]